MEPTFLPPASNLSVIFCLIGVLFCIFVFYPFINLSGALAIQKSGWAGTQVFRFESKVPILKNAFLAKQTLSEQNLPIVWCAEVRGGAGAREVIRLPPTKWAEARSGEVETWTLEKLAFFRIIGAKGRRLADKFTFGASSHFWHLSHALNAKLTMYCEKLE